MMQEPKQYSESPGTLRASQAVSMSGPGSIVQMEHDSILIMSIDKWSQQADCYKILHHAYLEQLLKKGHFRMPRQIDRHRVISCRSFPLWGVCSNPACGRLQKHRAAPLRGEKCFRCKDCNKEIYAAKFVAVCPNGHIEEFPWVEWAHSKASTERTCKRNPRLRFGARGQSPGLADCYVTCLDCKASRSCAGATSITGLKGVIPGCRGSMPWIGKDAAEACANSRGNAMPMHGIQIRSTSMYYPVTVSALHLPEWLHPVQKQITDNIEKIRAVLEINTCRDVAEKVSYLEGERKKYGVDEVEKHLEKRFSKTTQLDGNSKEAQVRNLEYKDLVFSEFEGDEYLDISRTPVHEDLAGYIGMLKQIKRLTEIRVMCAFTREAPADPYLSDGEDVRYCRISDPGTEWYPAVENRGEGFLFTLDEERLSRWEDEQAVKSRCGLVRGVFEDLFSKLSDEDPRRPPRYMLLHTLAHVLIRGVAEVSGYSEASIRERIYSGSNYGGVLLYTATPSSDGSLGGLVRQGGTESFANLVRATVQKSMRCSRDPFCAEDNPADMSRANIPLYARVNASACYGCVLLPETSCENVNRLLDRRLLFDQEFGYFREWA